MDSDWGEVETRYPYQKVQMDHLLSRETNDAGLILPLQCLMFKGV